LPREKKKIKGERRKHQPLTHQRHLVLPPRPKAGLAGCTINSSSSRERERAARVGFAFGARLERERERRERGGER